MKQNILLSLIVLFLCLVLAEFVLRGSVPEAVKVIDIPKTNWAEVPEQVWTEYHPVFGWYHQKSKKSFLIKNDLNVEVNTNSAGFRGENEYSTEKPKGVRRLLFLGDSFVFGFGVKDNETVTAILEDKIPNLEAINLGVAGYGIDQIALSYKEIGGNYDADVVFITIFPEDFWRATRSFADTGHAKPYYTLNASNDLVLNNVPVPGKFELDTNQFPDLVQYNSIESLLRKSLVYRLTKKALLKLGKNLGLVDPNTEIEWMLGKVILKNLISEIKNDGAVPVMVIVPPDRWARDNRQTSLYRSMLRLFKQMDAAYLDLLPVYVQAVKEGKLNQYYIENDGHWTYQGHQLFANVVLDFLKREKLIFNDV